MKILNWPSSVTGASRYLYIFSLTFSLCSVEIYGSSRIVNGTDAEQGEFPFAVSLRYKTKHTCGGTILNDNFVLSAAHCVCNNERPRNSSLYSIQYGLTEITTEPVNTRDIKKIYCHEFDSEKLVNDCAVLELETSLPDDGTWKPVTLSDDFSTRNPQTGLIIGWGKTGQNEPISHRLQKLSVDIFDDETCSSSWDNVHHICFGAMTGGACNGDSGTALLVKMEQVGIASFITNKCGIATKKHPNVYSRVASYRKWISNVISETDE
ncbi:chymotrypsin-2-like [Dendroctonus ponderosae]|uniref:chymotrypsin-2-like n=1 Tax=Dendroctonus ponderosae TaxID=77166 RepID=UPI00203503F4|nr:chymotrypsin-2-like [Dendroctonus ponderosae]